MSVNPLGVGSGQALNISVSGIRDASLRLDVAANNVANMNTNGFIPDRVDSAEAPSGGVYSYISSTANTPTSSAQANGSPNYSQTDLASEFTSIITAKAAYGANSKMVKAQNELYDYLFDAIDKTA